MAGVTLRGDQAVNVLVDNREQAKEFFGVFFDSEISTYFTAIVPPHRGKEGIVIQLVPNGQSRAVDEAFFDLLDRSLKSGMLAKWKDRTTELPRPIAA